MPGGLPTRSERVERVGRDGGEGLLPLQHAVARGAFLLQQRGASGQARQRGGVGAVAVAPVLVVVVVVVVVALLLHVDLPGGHRVQLALRRVAPP